MSQPPSEGQSNSQGQKYCIKLSGGNVLSQLVPTNQPCPQGYSPAPPGYHGGTPPVIGNPYSPTNPATGETGINIPAEVGKAANSVARSAVPGYSEVTDAINKIGSHILDPNMWKGVGLVGLALVLGIGGLVLLKPKAVTTVASKVA